MIEVLISMVVVAIGVLSISRMQLAMLRNNQGALFRSQASVLAYDMIDRLRADHAAATANPAIYALTMDSGSPAGASVADQQRRAWLEAVEQSLPEGDGSIEFAGGVFRVTVQWDDSRGEEDLRTFTAATVL